MKKPTIPLLLALAAGCIPPALRAEAPATDRAPSKLVWNVRPDEILESKTIHQGGRTVHIREILPIPLPPPAPHERREFDETRLRERAAAFHAIHPRRLLLSIGATVYRAADTPPRTLVRIMGDARRAPVELWAAADFGLITGNSGFGSFTLPDGTEAALLMLGSDHDMDKAAAMAARHGGSYQRPEIPEFGDGDEKSPLLVLSGEPDETLLSALEFLTRHIETHRETLLAARTTREAEARQRREFLRANPPEPRNLTLNYWRVPPTGKGDGQ